MERPDPNPNEMCSSPKEFDMQLLPAVEKTMPRWFEDIPWERAAEHELPEDAGHTIEYMAKIEGHVCSGYQILALASPLVRKRTEATDFVVGAWGPQENWHSIGLHRFQDQYEGREISTRAPRQDQDREQMRATQLHGWLAAGGFASIAPKTYTAAYASLGYRNEIMTLRGYGSLRSKINEHVGEPHPVLDPLLVNIMREEADHARYYRNLAEKLLVQSRLARVTTRFAMERWPNIVGENFAGSEGADRVIRDLFSDARDREIAPGIDRDLATLPGLSGITPTQERVSRAVAA